MPARCRVFYQGEQFTEGEFVVVNGKDIGYIGGVDKEKDGSETAWVHVYTTRTDWMPQMRKPWGLTYREWYMTKYSSKNGDVIEKANVLDYRLPSEPAQYGLYKPKDFLLDGWVICIILMIATLVLKPLGAWQIAILITWLIIRDNEIKRANGIKK